VAIRGLNDVRYVLVAHGDRIDWDDVVAGARADALADMLHRLIRAAERAEGRPLCPPEVLRSLEPSWISRQLFARQEGKAERAARVMAEGRRTRSQRIAARLQARLWQGRYVRGRLGRIRGAWQAATDRLQLRLFKSEIRRLRETGKGLEVAAPLRGPFRGRFVSACELRETAAPDELGFCLSRVRSGRRLSDPALQSALVRHLPDRSGERSLRKRTTIGDVKAQPHRCESFLVHASAAHVTPDP
jgi:hypothetical protein